MATIGLDRLYYSKITEAANGDETYAAPVQLAKAMQADLSVELAEAISTEPASMVVSEAPVKSPPVKAPPTSILSSPLLLAPAMSASPPICSDIP